jgi:hypothetical protein
MRTAKSTKTRAKKATSKSARGTAKTKRRATVKRRALAAPKKLAKNRETKPLAKSKAAGKTTKSKAASKAKALSKVKAKATSKARTTAKSKSPKTKERSLATANSRPPRRDATGRLDPQYARDLRALSRENRTGDDDRAFFNGPRSGDDLAEELGKEAVGSMTSGEDQSERLIGEEVEEERGGPFVKTRGGDEFARGTDRSNPRDATREPFPRT